MSAPPAQVGLLVLQQAKEGSKQTQADQRMGLALPAAYWLLSSAQMQLQRRRLSGQREQRCVELLRGGCELKE